MTRHARARRQARPRPSARSRYQLVNDQLFTPLLAYVAMFNTLGAYERQFGAATLHRQGPGARSRSTATLTVDDVFTGDSPMLGASTAIAGPITMLLANDVEPVTIEGLDVTIDHGRDAAQRDDRARLARRRAAARGHDDAAEGADPQLPRRREDLDGPDRDSRPTPRATCRSWSPTAGS